MLRVVYHKNKCIIKPIQEEPGAQVSPVSKKIPVKPTIITWRHIFHAPNDEFTIGTIQIVSYKWTKLALPKRKELHIPKKLCLWFHKLISKKYGITCNNFILDTTTNTYHATHKDDDDHWVSSKYFLQATQPDVIFIPIFDHKTLEIPSNLPQMLKIELEQSYNKMYNILVS